MNELKKYAEESFKIKMDCKKNEYACDNCELFLEMTKKLKQLPPPVPDKARSKDIMKKGQKLSEKNKMLLNTTINRLEKRRSQTKKRSRKLTQSLKKSKGGARSKRKPPPVPSKALPRYNPSLFDPTTTERNKMLLESAKTRMNKKKSKTKKKSQRLSRSLKSKGRKRTPLRGRLRMHQVPKPEETKLLDLFDVRDEMEYKNLEKSMKLLEKDRRFRNIFQTIANKNVANIPLKQYRRRIMQHDKWIKTGKNPSSEIDRYDYALRSWDPNSKSWVNPSVKEQNKSKKEHLLWTLANYNKALEIEKKTI